MGTIETKIHQLQELSRQQKKVNEIKQDIADILGNADMDEKKKIAEQMSKMEYENMHQARNLQFIVPNLVKELYDHEGPKWEFVIPKKEAEKKDTEPTPETKEEISTPVKPEKKGIEKKEEIQQNEPIVETKREKKQESIAPTTERIEQKPKEDNKKEKTETGKANEWAWKVFVVPWFDIQKPVIETEKIKEQPAKPVVEPRIEPTVEKIIEPTVIQQPENIQPEIIEEKTESTQKEEKEKKKKSFKLINILGIKTRKQKIEIQQEKIAKIQKEKKNLRQQAWKLLENETKNLSEPGQELLKNGIGTGEIKAKDIDAKIPQTEKESFYYYAKELMIKIKE